MTGPAMARRAIPSVDRLLGQDAFIALAARYGRVPVVETLRAVLADERARLGDHSSGKDADPASDPVTDARADSGIDTRNNAVGDPHAAFRSDGALADLCAERLARSVAPSLRRVFNLTGTVLHTNLGRALYSRAAIDAAVEAMTHPSNLEFDLENGKRGERDRHVESWITRLTGAEAAAIVNNNAAAVYLVLNTLATRKEVIVSRGELIEIGGAFRIPDIMSRAGCRLCEVGTTNRTHLPDYSDAIGPRTGAVMKVHTSNYAIQGFTASVSESALASVARASGLPLIVDLGSGTLIDLEAFGLPHEHTVRETIAAGADIVTFSGDKLLGGPQAGIVAGRADLVARIRTNPMKRAMRVDKVTLAALEATLRLYSDPARAARDIPTLRLLSRPAADIEAAAQRILPAVADALRAHASVSVVPCMSQIGSGALPVDALPGAALAITPHGRSRGSAVTALAAALRRLPIPVLGRVRDNTLLLDLRCLDDEEEAAFVTQLRTHPVPL